jgi:sarcosine oxidase subunit beta
LEADLAWESLTDYFELWGERVGGGCGFTQTGFAFLASSEDSSAVQSNVAMLREHVGIDTELVNPAELNEIDPALETGDVVIAAYEPRSGYADPSATTISLLRAAQDFGAQFKKHRVVSLVERGNRILERLATKLGCTASWKDECLLGRPAQEDRRGCGEGDA